MRNSIYCLLCNEEKNIVDFIASIDGQLGSIDGQPPRPTRH